MPHLHPRQWRVKMVSDLSNFGIDSLIWGCLFESLPKPSLDDREISLWLSRRGLVFYILRLWTMTAASKATIHSIGAICLQSFSILDATYLFYSPPSMFFTFVSFAATTFQVYRARRNWEMESILAVEASSCVEIQGFEWWILR